MNDIYKILTEDEWNQASKIGYVETALDKEDGFIHFSEEDQVTETLKKHYPNKENLILLKVNAFKLEHLLWEQASNGHMYPQLYSALDIKNVEYDSSCK